jgi:hypothetical protein
VKSITVAARSKASAVFALSNPVVVGSNLTRGKDVSCLFCVCVSLCVGNDLETGLIPRLMESYRLSLGSRNRKIGQSATMGYRVIIIIIVGYEMLCCKNEDPSRINTFRKQLGQ